MDKGADGPRWTNRGIIRLMGMVCPASCSMGEARTEHRAPCEVLKRHAITTLQNMVVIAREPLSALPADWQWPLRVAERTREAHRASASASEPAEGGTHEPIAGL